MTRRANKWATGMAVGIALVGISARRASADEPGPLGTKGQVILGANRLINVLGYESQKTSDIVGGMTVSNTQSQVTFAVSGGSPIQPTTVFTIPRIGGDYAFIEHWTLGLDLFAWTTPSRSNDQSGGGAGQSTSAPKATLFGIAPRVGYVFSLNDHFKFWPRGGFSFSEVFVGGDDAKLTQVAIDLEPLFVITPVSHFGITLGPVFDIPLTGTASTTSNGQNGAVTVSHDSAQFYGGLSLGMIGWL